MHFKTGNQINATQYHLEEEVFSDDFLENPFFALSHV